jgi:hypothetical protein
VWRKKGSAPAYLADALRPFPWDRRHRHVAAIEVPPGQKVDVHPRHRLAARVQPARMADATYTRSRGGLWRGGLHVLRRGGGARGEDTSIVRGRGGGGMRRRASEPKPEASRSCLVFLLKGQRLVMVAAAARSVAMTCHDLPYIGQRALAAAQHGHRDVATLMADADGQVRHQCTLTTRWTRRSGSADLPVPA